MESVQENIKSLEFINGCGDEYTVVQIDQITEKYQKEKAEREEIEIFCYIMIAAIVVYISIAAFALFYRWKTGQLLRYYEADVQEQQDQ